MDRERMIDMDLRLQPVRQKSFIVLAAALLLIGPWYGFWTLIPLAIAGALFRLADRRIEKTTHPELGIFAAWAGSEIMIAISVALTGGPLSPAISWFAIPAVTLCARFSARGIIIGVIYAITLMLGVSLGVNGEAVFQNPALVVGPAALLIAVAVLTIALMESEIEHRNEAVIDPLTGLLNRKALTSRAAELAQQSEITGQPIGIVVGDLDHFKGVNDTYGHAVGDAVLKDLAYLFRSQLRAFDLTYRIGGEELLVLLPGSDRAEALELAEKLRLAIVETPLGGRPVTMSFGVSASQNGHRFDYEEVFMAADAALYEAKRAGRNTVRGGLLRPGLARPELLIEDQQGTAVVGGEFELVDHQRG